jgi:hypothetical protein
MPTESTSAITSATPANNAVPNKSTQLALRFLLGDGPDRDDAFKGLIKLCFAALNSPKKVRIHPGQWDIRGTKSAAIPEDLDAYVGEEVKRKLWESGVEELTRDFIVEFLLNFFAPYHGLEQREIEALALQDKFKHIGHLCRLRVIDESVKRKTKKHAGPLRDSLNFKIGDEDSDYEDRESESGDLLSTKTDGYVGSSLDPDEGIGVVVRTNTQPQFDNASPILQVVRQHEKEIKADLGQEGYEDLLVLIEAQYSNPGSSKGSITKAIAANAKVKERQARARKVSLNDLARKAMKEQRPWVTKLFKELKVHTKGMPTHRRFGSESRIGKLRT